MKNLAGKKPAGKIPRGDETCWENNKWGKILGEKTGGEKT